MNEAERKAALEHLLAFETAEDVGRHLDTDHGYENAASGLLGHRELDQVHVAEHRRPARNPKCQAHDRPWSAPCVCGLSDEVFTATGR